MRGLLISGALLVVAVGLLALSAESRSVQAVDGKALARTLGMTPDAVASLDIDATGANTVLTRLAAMTDESAALDTKQSGVTSLQTQVRAKEAELEATPTDATLLQEHQTLLTNLATAQTSVRVQRESMITTALAGFASAGHAIAVCSPPRSHAQLPAPYRLANLTAIDCKRLRYALAREARAVARDTSLASTVAAFLAQVRQDVHVQAAITAQNDHLTEVSGVLLGS